MSNDNPLRDIWQMFQKEHDCSIDRMLCNPQLRSEFLSAARSATRCDDEEELLWSLIAMRKRKALSPNKVKSH